MYELLDEACAYELNVSIKTYIDKIEKTTEKRRMVIIGAILSDNPILIKKAQRIFNLIH